MKTKIGEIELGEIAYLSDPCYGTMSRGNTTISVIPGVYLVFVTRSESKSRFIENRINNLIVVHKDYYSKFKTYPKNDKEGLYCAVDSGCCGVFNCDYYEQYHTENDVNDDWYDKNVINMDEFIITEGKGAISCSGLGDGVYGVFAEYVDDKAFAIRIKFI